MTKIEARNAKAAYSKALIEGRVVRLGYGATFKTFATPEEACKACAEYRAAGIPANIA